MADSVDFCTTDILSRYPSIDPDVEGVVDRLSTIQKHAAKIFEKTLAGCGLNHGEYRLLLRLATRTDDKKMSAGRLSQLLLLSSGAMTNRLDRMESAGLVRRVPDPTDRRGVLVEMTAKGEKVLDGAVLASAKEDAAMLDVLSAKETTQLNALLRKVLEALEVRPDLKDEKPDHKLAVAD
ncbi:MAG: MarR family winged helix-turn-helix transcriptional regulator [Actinomycetes bacterium]